MARAAGRILLWIGAALALLVAVAVVVVSRWDWGAEVAGRAGDVLHRKVSVGTVGLRLRRVTHLHLGRIVIDNAPWGSGPHLAEIDAVDLDIDLLELLRGRVVLPSLVLSRPRLLLEKSADGKANWDFSQNPQAAAAIAPVMPSNRHQVPLIERLSIDDGALTYRDPAKGIDLSSRVATAVAGDPAHGKVTLAGTGTIQGQPFRLEAEGGALLALKEGDQPYPLRLEMTVGQTHGRIEGTLDDPLKLSGVNLRLGLEGPDLAALFPIIGIPTPRTPPYALAGQLTHAGDQWALDGFSGRVGSSDLAGSLSVRTGGVRPFLRADLVSDRLDLRDLAGFIGGGGPKPKSSRVLPDRPLQLDRLRAMDMEVRFTGRHIEGRDMPLKRLDAALGLDGGLLVLDPLSFTLKQGEFSGRIELDGRRDVPAARLDLRLSRVDFGQFFAGTRFAGKMSGIMDGRIQVAGRGRSTAQVLGGGDGRLVLTMADGSVSALVQELAELDIGNALGIAVTKDEPVAVRCLVADLRLAHGTATPSLLLLDTDESTITADGTVDLGAETMDLKLEGHPKHPSVFSARAPIAVDGAWTHPRVRVEAGREVLRGAAAAALGALLTPLAAIVPFLSPGSQQDPPCGQLVAELRGAERRR
ncbi:MAG: AsmA family protein [Actinomycetota bacterium]